MEALPGDNHLTNHIAVSTVHHAALTVSNLERAAQFYMDVLGFQQVAEFGPKKILSNGHMILGLGPASDTSAHERFDESCVGLDHLSFSVASRADLARAAQVLDTHGVPHGDITDLTDFGIAILAFRAPDNIQLELTAPLGTL